MPDQPLQELTVAVIQRCPACRGLLGGWTATHLGECPNRFRAWVPESVEVVSLAVAENLAAALEHIAEGWKYGSGAGPAAAKALAEYRALVPAKTTEETG